MSELKQYLEMQSEALSSKASAEDDIIHSTVSKAKAFTIQMPQGLLSLDLICLRN